MKKSDFKIFAASMIITLTVVFGFYALNIVNENSSKTGGLKKSELLSVKTAPSELVILFMGNEYTFKFRDNL